MILSPKDYYKKNIKKEINLSNNRLKRTKNQLYQVDGTKRDHVLTAIGIMYAMYIMGHCRDFCLFWYHGVDAITYWSFALEYLTPLSDVGRRPHHPCLL